MRVIAIRHGQTDWNAADRLLGRTDIALNGVGREQAKNVAPLLPCGICKIFSSPLIRAKETAEIINKRFLTEITIEDRLIERNFGDYEGVSMKELNMNSLRRWTDNAPIPNGETICDVTKRVFEFLDEIKYSYFSEIILIVAHSHVLRPVYWYFNGIPTYENEEIIEIKTCEFQEYYISSN